MARSPLAPDASIVEAPPSKAIGEGEAAALVYGTAALAAAYPAADVAAAAAAVVMLELVYRTSVTCSYILVIVQGRCLRGCCSKVLVQTGWKGRWQW